MDRQAACREAKHLETILPLDKHGAHDLLFLDKKGASSCKQSNTATIVGL